MAFDQDITYRVNIDDANFQAKLSQLRASMDMTIGGGFGGMNMAGMGAMMGPMGNFNAPMSNAMVGGGQSFQPFMGGIADFGAQIRPITYTPPAIAMQPHFGMVAVQQSTGQAMAGMAGPYGSAAYNMRSIGGGAVAGAFAGGVVGGPLGALGGAAVGAATGFVDTLRSGGFTKDLIPEQLTTLDYMHMSSRTFGARLGDAVGSAALVGGTTAASLGVSALTGAAGAGLIGSMAMSLPAAYLGGKVSDMVADNRAMQSALEAGSFRFITGGKDVDPYTGRGFSRQARASVADTIQSMELKDARYGMDEYKQILEGGMQLNLFSGTGDAESFKSKFKDLVNTLKTVTSVLHTSLKEGMEVIRGFNDMGITDGSQISAMSFKADAMGRATGRTGLEMLQIGQTGADMFRGTGINMQLGFETNQMNALITRSLMNQRDANNNPLLSRETVAQAGGELEMAKQATATALGFTQTAFGRGILMAATRGGSMVDPAKIAGGNAQSLLSNAANMTAGEMVHFEANQEEIIGKMSPMTLMGFQMGGAMAQARTLSGAGMGINFKDAFVMLQKRNGVPIDEIKRQKALLESDPSKLEKDMEENGQRAVEAKALEDYRNNFGVKKLMNVASEYTVQPIQRQVSRLIGGVEDFVREKAEKLTGGTTVATSGIMSKEMIDEGKKLLEAKGGYKDGGYEKVVKEIGADVTDASATSLQKKFGGQEKLAEAIDKFGEDYNGLHAKHFNSVEEVQAAAKNGKAYHIITKSSKSDKGSIIAVPTKELLQASEDARDNAPSSSDISKANEGTLSSKLTVDQKVSVQDYLKEHQKDGTVQGMGEAMFGKDFKLEKASGYQKALIGRSAKDLGAESVTLDYENKMGDSASKALGMGAGDIIKRADDETRKAYGMLVGAKGFFGGMGFRRALTRAQESDPSNVSSLLKLASLDPDSKEAKTLSFDLKEKLGQDYEEISSGIQSLTPEKKKELGEQFEKSAKWAKIAQVQKNMAQGTSEELSTKNLNGPVASLSGETLSQMGEMVKSIKTEMKMINDLVTKWQTATGLK